jgi:hypothetical protein
VAVASPGAPQWGNWFDLTVWEDGPMGLVKMVITLALFAALAASVATLMALAPAAPYAVR